MISFFEKMSQDFYRNFIFEKRFLWLLEGLKNTLQMTFFAVLIGIAIGLLLAWIRVLHRSGIKMGLLNTLATSYITLIRGTPVMVQILIINFGIFASVPASKLLVASMAFGLNSGAYAAEIFRAGIEAVDDGQMEAARSLGLGYAASMHRIILPQAVKKILPALFNEFITLLKETSISGYIAFGDLTRAGDHIRALTYNIQPLLMVALIYLLVVVFLTRLMKWLEKRLARSDRRS